MNHFFVPKRRKKRRKKEMIKYEKIDLGLIREIYDKSSRE